MCYSAQIWADFRKYERLGGTLSIKEFTKLAGWTRKKGTWVKAVPRALRQAMTDATSGRLPIDTVEEARAAGVPLPGGARVFGFLKRFSMVGGGDGNGNAAVEAEARTVLGSARLFPRPCDPEYGPRVVVCAHR